MSLPLRPWASLEPYSAAVIPPGALFCLVGLVKVSKWSLDSTGWALLVCSRRGVMTPPAIRGQTRQDASYLSSGGLEERWAAGGRQVSGISSCHCLGRGVHWRAPVTTFLYCQSYEGRALSLSLHLSLTWQPPPLDFPRCLCMRGTGFTIMFALLYR